MHTIKGMMFHAHSRKKNFPVQTQLYLHLCALFVKSKDNMNAQPHQFI